MCLYTIPSQQTAPYLALLICALIIAAALDVLIRYKKYHEPAQLLSPLALFALLLLIKIGANPSFVLPSDDYHFGEQLLGWWSYLQGSIPYADYLPPHGIIVDDFSGWLNHVFYGGGAIGVIEGQKLSFAMIGLTTFIAIYRFSKSTGLAFIATYVLGANIHHHFSSGLLLLSIFLYLWLQLKLIDQPSKWLSTWLLSMPILVLAIPAQGLVLIAASAPVACYILYALCQEPKKISLRLLGLSALTLVALCFFSPLPSMLFNAIRYVVENAQINQIAYGIPWHDSWTAAMKFISLPRKLKPLASFIISLPIDIIRLSWLAAMAASLGILYGYRKSILQNKLITLPATVSLILLLLLTPYSMGRIDPWYFSRPGFVSILAWATLLPLMLWHTLKSKHRPLLVAFVALVGLTVSPPQLNLNSILKPTHCHSIKSAPPPTLAVHALKQHIGNVCCDSRNCLIAT